MTVSEAIAAAQRDGVALHALASALPKDAAANPPEWITVFPAGGAILTRDGRRYEIDAAALMAAYAGDGIEIPVDIDHSVDAGLFGGRPIIGGWIAELRATKNGGLEAKVDWLGDGRDRIAARTHRYTSPSFYHTKEGRATRLKAVSLVPAPALANQPALAAASQTANEPATETGMDKIAQALGLAGTPDETALLAALNAKLAGLAPKAELDAANASLAAATTELATLKAETRKVKVDGVIEAALAAKKILPAEREDYLALCATDEGLATVEKLLGAKTPVLGGSGLGEKPQPGQGKVDASDPAKLGAAASAYMAEQAAKGITVSAAEAVAHLTGEKA